MVLVFAKELPLPEVHVAVVAAGPGLVGGGRAGVEAGGPEAVADEVRADGDALEVPDEVPEEDRVRVDDARVQQARVAVRVQLVLQLLPACYGVTDQVLLTFCFYSCPKFNLKWEGESIVGKLNDCSGPIGDIKAVINSAASSYNTIRLSQPTRRQYISTINIPHKTVQGLSTKCQQKVAADLSI